jgi:NitT/TauT family transport system substrate-binding protein
MRRLIERRGARGRRRQAVVAVAAGLVLTAAGCGGQGGAGASLDSVTIAYQPGISYAPLVLIKHDKVLEKQFPKTKFTWKVLSSSAAVQDGMISGDIQVGAGSVGQLVLGWDKGVGWRYLSAMNDTDLWLTAKNPNLRSLKDFKAGDKIAMPSPTSLQAMVLRKGAEQQLGNAHALDTNIVSMAHPDGLQALMSGQIAGHLGSPPFQFQEQQNGAQVILRSKDLFGRHTFNGVFLTSRFYDGQKAFAQQLYKDLQDAVQQLTSDPGKAAQALSEDSGGTPTAASFKDYITNPAITYTTEPHGLMAIATFMKQIKLVDKAPQSWKDLVFPTAQNLNGS